MRCPFCGSDNYDYVGTMDYDESSTTLEFKCLGSCGKTFFGMYSFMYFEDNEGKEVKPCWWSK